MKWERPYDVHPLTGVPGLHRTDAVDGMTVFFS